LAARGSEAVPLSSAAGCSADAGAKVARRSRDASVVSSRVGLDEVGGDAPGLNSDASPQVESASSSPCVSSLPPGAGGDPVFPRDLAASARNPSAEDTPVATDVAVDSAGLGTTPATSDHVESNRDREDSVAQSLSSDVFACTLPDPPLTSSSSLSVAPVLLEPPVVEGSPNTSATKRTAEQT